MVALPFCHVTLKAEKPPSTAYPKHLNTFGNYLRKVRLDLGLYQKDLAEMAGFDEMTICSWERSLEFPRRYSLVKKLCGVLDIDYEQMLVKYHPLWREFAQGFASELLRGRIRLGITQEDMAKLAGLDPTTLSRWENSPELPAKWMRDKLARLCGVLGVSVPSENRD
jgi:transcriptional regulator with XRE-family HTH domain